MSEIKTNDTVLVLGGSGLLGRNVVHQLVSKGYSNILRPTHKELNLTSASRTRRYLKDRSSEISAVVMCAGLVGGISSNDAHKFSFALQNARMAINLFSGLKWLTNLKKVVYVGSSCIYPRNASVPITEDSLLAGSLEPTNEAYAIAKILGISLSKYFQEQTGICSFSIMPCNLFGEGDRGFYAAGGHVIPDLIKKFYKAMRENKSSVVVGGTGAPIREFLHAKEAAKGIVLCLETYHSQFGNVINMGSELPVSIRELAESIRYFIGFKGDIEWNTSFPDGHPNKIMDSSKIKSIGFYPNTDTLNLKNTIDWFVEKADKNLEAFEF